jgi:hypothetical protein
MSDSLPPVWGLTPEEERDLEAVLSGEPARPGEPGQPGERARPGERSRPGEPGRAGHAGRPPRPAAAVLAGLRAAPGPGELNGEAAARAAYRLFVLPAGTWPAQAGDAATAPLPPVPPASPAGGGPRPLGRPGARHRRPRRGAPWRGRRPGAALLGAVGAAGLLVALVCVLVLPGSSGQPGRGVSGTHSAAEASGSTAKEAEPLGSGTKEASPTPTAASSDPEQGTGSADKTPKREELCQEYFRLFQNSGLPGGWPGNSRFVKKLAAAAGGQRNILDYCGAFGAGSQGSGAQQAQTGAPHPDPGSTAAGSGSSGGQGGLGSVGRGRSAAATGGPR